MSLPPEIVRSIIGQMRRQRGVNAEQRAVRAFRSDGWFAARVRRGPIDVIASKDGGALLAQVKSGGARATKAELGLLVEWGRAYNADAEVWYYKGKGRVIRRRVFAARRTLVAG